MTLGRDVSRLSTNAANAAAQGLSIVVPLYNEAANLGLLHERLGALATALKARYGLACEVVYVDDGSADATLSIARGLAAGGPGGPGGVPSRAFGQGEGAEGGGPAPPGRR